MSFVGKEGFVFSSWFGLELADRALGRIQGILVSEHYVSLYIFSNKAPSYLEDTFLFQENSHSFCFLCHFLPDLEKNISCVLAGNKI
jgi:hypothetical protein